MAAVDFPNTPTNGQEFSANNKTWVWDALSQVWKILVSEANPSSMTVSQIAPLDPGQGDLWFNSVDGSTYIYYDGFWVELVTKSINEDITEIQSQLATKASTGKAIAMAIVFGG
jgi:hypothetical protein